MKMILGLQKWHEQQSEGKTMPTPSAMVLWWRCRNCGAWHAEAYTGLDYFAVGTCLLCKAGMSIKVVVEQRESTYGR
jgi:hypothetical protein